MQSDLRDTAALPKLLLWGIDSLYASYCLNISESRLDLDELAYQRERLKDTRSKKFQRFRLGTEEFALMPYGQYPYTYVIANKAFRICLSEHMQPSAYVQFHSEALWMEGKDRLLSRFDHWCKTVGLSTIKPESVSRVDWAFDFHLPSIDFAWDDFVSRAAKDNSWREHRKHQTFQFGTGDIVIRIYDKTKEIAQQSNKVWFHDLWGRESEVWRVEFQVRKDVLGGNGIHTQSDIDGYAGRLLQNLASSHTSLRKPTTDTNRSRRPLHPLWQAVTSGIAKLPMKEPVLRVDANKPLRWRQYQQAKSIYGMLKGFGAVTGAIGRSNRSNQPGRRAGSATGGAKRSSQSAYLAKRPQTAAGRAGVRPMVRVASNDNQGSDAGSAEAPSTTRNKRRGSRSKPYPSIHTDLPEKLPILKAEIDLIQTYLSDIIGLVIANDNDQ